MEKTGFIYIWYDRKRKMYYVGCHWGSEDDGYICSSKRMNDAYRYRPQDFKRRIIQRGITDRKTLLEVEHKWLQFIPDKELGKQYYNHSKKHCGHWINFPNANETRKKCARKTNPTFTPEELEKRGKNISEAKTKRKQERLSKTGSPYTQKQLDSFEKRKGEIRGPQSEELKRKKSETMKNKIENCEWKSWSTGKTLGPQTPERIEKRAAKLKGKKRSIEQRLTISEANKKSWAEGKYTNRKPNNMRDYIWVRRKEDNSRTRIKKELYNNEVYILGR